MAQLVNFMGFYFILHGQLINLKYMTEKLIRIQRRVYFQGRYQEFYLGRALAYFSFQEGSAHVGALPLETIDFIDQEGLRPHSPPPPRLMMGQFGTCTNIKFFRILQIFKVFSEPPEN